MQLMNQNNFNLSSLGGKNGLMERMRELEKSLKNQGKTPEQYLNELIESGQMSQSDLNKYKQLASLVSNIL